VSPGAGADATASSIAAQACAWLLEAAPLTPPALAIARSAVARGKGAGAGGPNADESEMRLASLLAVAESAGRIAAAIVAAGDFMLQSTSETSLT